MPAFFERPRGAVGLLKKVSTSIPCFIKKYLGIKCPEVEEGEPNEKFLFFNSALVVVLSAASLTSNATVSKTFAAEQLSPLEFKPPLSILFKPSVKLFLSELSELKPIASSSLSRFKDIDEKGNAVIETDIGEEIITSGEISIKGVY